MLWVGKYKSHNIYTPMQHSVCRLAPAVILWIPTWLFFKNSYNILEGEGSKKDLQTGPVSKLLLANTYS